MWMWTWVSCGTEKTSVSSHKQAFCGEYGNTLKEVGFAHNITYVVMNEWASEVEIIP